MGSASRAMCGRIAVLVAALGLSTMILAGCGGGGTTPTTTETTTTTTQLTPGLPTSSPTPLPTSPSSPAPSTPMPTPLAWNPNMTVLAGYLKDGARVSANRSHEIFKRPLAEILPLYLKAADLVIELISGEPGKRICGANTGGGNKHAGGEQCQSKIRSFFEAHEGTQVNGKADYGKYQMALWTGLTAKHTAFRCGSRCLETTIMGSVMDYATNDVDFHSPDKLDPAKTSIWGAVSAVFASGANLAKPITPSISIPMPSSYLFREEIPSIIQSIKEDGGHVQINFIFSSTQVCKQDLADRLKKHIPSKNVQCETPPKAFLKAFFDQKLAEPEFQGVTAELLDKCPSTVTACYKVWKKYTSSHSEPPRAPLSRQVNEAQTPGDSFIDATTSANDGIVIV